MYSNFTGQLLRKKNDFSISKMIFLKNGLLHNIWQQMLYYNNDWVSGIIQWVDQRKAENDV